MPRISSPVYFIGAGPGDPELITVKGKRLIEDADLIIYAGSLVNPQILEGLRAELVDSSALSLEQTTNLVLQAMAERKKVVRLHSGDPSLYGAILEQMRPLEEAGVDVEVIPGVSSLFAPLPLSKLSSPSKEYQSRSSLPGLPGLPWKKTT